VIRISSAGNVGIGATNPSYPLQVQGGSSYQIYANGLSGIEGVGSNGVGLYGLSSSNYGVNGKNTGSNTWGGFFYGSSGVYGQSGGSSGYGAEGYNGGTGCYGLLGYSTKSLHGNCDIYTGTNMYAAGYFHNSDKRLKDNLRPIDNSLWKVLQLTGYSFDWNKKANTAVQGKHNIGVIAQDVQKVALEAVNTDTDTSYLTVDYTRLVPLLINAIKELDARLDDLAQSLSSHFIHGATPALFWLLAKHFPMLTFSWAPPVITAALLTMVQLIVEP
jgi:hypothetical protein